MYISGVRVESLLTVYSMILVVFLNEVTIPKRIDNFCECHLFSQEKERQKFLPSWASLDDMNTVL